jgi:hypothetical protein
MFCSTDKYNYKAYKQWISRNSLKKRTNTNSTGLAHTQIITFQRSLLYVTAIIGLVTIKKDDRFRNYCGNYRGNMQRQCLFSPSVRVKKVRVVMSTSVFCMVTAPEGASVETRYRAGTDSTAETSPVVDLCGDSIREGRHRPLDWGAGYSCD